MNPQCWKYLCCRFRIKVDDAVFMSSQLHSKADLNSAVHPEATPMLTTNTLSGNDYSDTKDVAVANGGELKI